MEKIFDLFFGLPLHPLIDHVVVIFLPVFSMALIASFFFTNIRKKYGFLIQAGLGIAAVSAFIAKQSGEALSMRIGTPIKHAELGENLVLIAFGLFVSSLVWFYLQKNSNSVLTKISGVVSVLLAIAALVFTVLVGHSGAKATWDEKINSKPAVQQTTPSSQNTGAASLNSTSAITLDATEVSKHNNLNDCWSVVNNQVYNLTSYVNSHPGGVKNIEQICGKDGSVLFKNQHGSQSRPNNVLTGLLLGSLADSGSNLSTPTKSVGGENEGDDD